MIARSRVKIDEYPAVRNTPKYVSKIFYGVTGEWYKGFGGNVEYTTESYK